MLDRCLQCCRLGHLTGAFLAGSPQRLTGFSAVISFSYASLSLLGTARLKAHLALTSVQRCFWPSISLLLIWILYVCRQEYVYQIETELDFVTYSILKGSCDLCISWTAPHIQQSIDVPLENCECAWYVIKEEGRF